MLSWTPAGNSATSFKLKAVVLPQNVVHARHAL